MKYQTHYNRIERDHENKFGASITETAGFISAKKRIEGMIHAGIRLHDFRSHQFDFPGEEIDENFDDVTRRPGFDMADASSIVLETEQRLDKRNKQKKDSPEDQKKNEIIDNSVTDNSIIDTDVSNSV